MLLDINEHFSNQLNILGRPHKGVVVDNNDPEKLGRVKVSIVGLLQGSNDNLPWISQRSPSMLGGQPDKGNFFVPSVGSELEIIFPHRDIYSGFYVGFWQTPNTHNAAFDDGYPDKYGFIDSGFTVSYDGAKEEFILAHPQGATITIKPDGSVEITTDGKATVKGTGGTDIGDSSSVTNIKGSQVILADGGPPVARHGDTVVGSNAGGPLVGGTVIATGTKVLAG